MKKLIVLILFSASLHAQQPPPPFPPEQQGKAVEAPEVFTIVEEMPEFPGGQQAFAKYLQKNIKYPKKARRQGISGKCFIKFIVDERGKIESAQVLKGVNGCPECDAEAIRVIKKMPDWKPGKQKGRPVKCYFSLPINFKISDNH